METLTQRSPQTIGHGEHGSFLRKEGRKEIWNVLPLCVLCVRESKREGRRQKERSSKSGIKSVFQAWLRSKFPVNNNKRANKMNCQKQNKRKVLCV